MKCSGYAPSGNSSRIPFQEKRGIAGRHRKCQGNIMTLPDRSRIYYKVWE